MVAEEAGEGDGEGEEEEIWDISDLRGNNALSTLVLNLVECFSKTLFLLGRDRAVKHSSVLRM